MCSTVRKHTQPHCFQEYVWQAYWNLNTVKCFSELRPSPSRIKSLTSIMPASWGKHCQDSFQALTRHYYAMFWDGGQKHCSNITVRSSRLLLQDTFSSTIAIFLWQCEQRGQSFLLQNCYFCYSLTDFSFLTVFHVSILSFVLPVQLPRCHTNTALSLIAGWKASHTWAFNGQCSVVPTLLPLLRPHLTPLDAGVQPKNLHVAHGVALAPSLPQQRWQQG